MEVEDQAVEAAAVVAAEVCSPEAAQAQAEEHHRMLDRHHLCPRHDHSPSKAAAWVSEVVAL